MNKHDGHDVFYVEVGETYYNFIVGDNSDIELTGKVETNLTNEYFWCDDCGRKVSSKELGLDPYWLATDWTNTTRI